MKRLLIVVLLVAAIFVLGLVIAGVAVWKLKTSEPLETDIQAIKGIVQEWEDGFNAGEIDTGRGMLHLADDAIAVRPNEPALVGREAIRSGRKQWAEELLLQEDYVVENVDISGNLAVVYATWSNIVTPKSGGEPRRGNGNWILIFKKQPDGKWNCTYSIYSNENLISPTQAE